MRAHSTAVRCAAYCSAMDDLIFGFHGQLGHALTQRLPDATAVDHAGCDITSDIQVDTVLSSYTPSRVFNAAAFNFVDRAEEERDLAFAVNGAAPGRLAAAARRVCATFVHFSTDYVFGDGHSEPIDESQTPQPLSVYGRSKLLGEQLALQNNTQTFVIRTTGLYSHRRRNFVRTMIQRAVHGEKLTVVSDQYVSPTWVESVADVALRLVDTDVYGVYHVVAQGACSWFEYAGRIFEILDLNADLHPTDQAAWRAAARRPAYSALDDAMLRAVHLERIGAWDDELARFLAVHGAALIEEASTMEA